MHEFVLGEYFGDHVSVDISQTTFDSVVVVRELLVIESQQMENRGMKIMNSNH